MCSETIKYNLCYETGVVLKNTCFTDKYDITP